MRISDLSSDVFSSDLYDHYAAAQAFPLINGQPVSTNADASEQRLIRSPEWILSGGLDYSPEIAGGEADFHIGYNYSASYRLDVMGYMRQDKYGVWNASARFTIGRASCRERVCQYV